MVGSFNVCLLFTSNTATMVPLPKVDYSVGENIYMLPSDMKLGRELFSIII